MPRPSKDSKPVCQELHRLVTQKKDEMARLPFLWHTVRLEYYALRLNTKVNIVYQHCALVYLVGAELTRQLRIASLEVVSRFAFEMESKNLT